MFAVAVSNPSELVEKLWRHGFDATNHSSLRVVGESDNELKSLLAQMVFLPIDTPMPESEIVRLGELVGQFGKPANCCELSRPSMSQEHSDVLRELSRERDFLTRR